MKRSTPALAIACLAGAGCFSGSGPAAERVRPDDNSSCYAQGRVHFVEDGRRGEGVLVSASPGGHNAFNVSWATLLAATPPTTIAGPAWTGRRLRDDDVLALVALPAYRDAARLAYSGERVRACLGVPAVWVLSTRPLVYGVPAGEPRWTWQQYASAATVGPPSLALDSYVARLVVDGELDQPLSAIVRFGPEVLADYETWVDRGGTLVTLARPITIDEALDALAGPGLPNVGDVKPIAFAPPSSKGDADPIARERREVFKRHAEESRARRAASR